LYKSEREHIREGAIQIKVKAAKGQPQLTPASLFLFNDTLLWAKKVQVDKTNKTSLQFMRSLALKSITAITNLDSEGKGAFEITIDRVEKESFMADNEDQRHSWVAAIATAASAISPLSPWKKFVALPFPAYLCPSF